MRRKRIRIGDPIMKKVVLVDTAEPICDQKNYILNFGNIDVSSNWAGRKIQVSSLGICLLILKYIQQRTSWHHPSGIIHNSDTSKTEKGKISDNDNREVFRPFWTPLPLLQSDFSFLFKMVINQHWLQLNVCARLESIPFAHGGPPFMRLQKQKFHDKNTISTDLMILPTTTKHCHRHRHCLRLSFVSDAFVCVYWATLGDQMATMACLVSPEIKQICNARWISIAD